MIRLSSSTKTITERAQMEYLNETRNCVLLKDMPQILIGGKQFGPYSISSRIDLPIWAIEKLVKNGYLELSEDEDIASLIKIQEITREARESPHELQPFHPLLYSAINRKLLNLQSDKSSLDPRLFDELEKLERMVLMLLESRLSKIMRIAKAGAMAQRKNMTLEEQWLYQELTDILSNWRKELFS